MVPGRTRDSSKKLMGKSYYELSDIICAIDSKMNLMDEKININEWRFHIINRRLAEAIGIGGLRAIQAVRQIKIYWGTAPTGRIHIGYMIPLLKIADFLSAGCAVTILLADLHAILDNLKSTPDLINARVTYYQELINLVLAHLNVPLENLTFVKGSDFQLQSAYTFDMYKLAAMTTVHDCKKAGTEVVKQTDNPKTGSLLYPIMQALDEEYLDVDATLGGIDQRRIYTLASEILPKVNHKKRIHLMNPMLSSVSTRPSTDNISDIDISTKMSSTDTTTKIDLLDDKHEIISKINQAYCLEGNTTFNTLLELTDLLIFPLLENQNIDIFVVNRLLKYGGPLIYRSYEQLVTDFTEKKLHPQDLKLAISECLNNFLEPIRKEFLDNNEWLKVLTVAYPDDF